jgi:hypothetical protein
LLRVRTFDAQNCTICSSHTFNIKTLQLGDDIEGLGGGDESGRQSVGREGWDIAITQADGLGHSLRNFRSLSIYLCGEEDSGADNCVIELLKSVPQLRILKIEWLEHAKIFDLETGVTMPSLEEAEFVSCAFYLENVVAFIKQHRENLKRFAISGFNYLGRDNITAEAKIREQLARQVEGHIVQLTILDLWTA